MVRQLIASPLFLRRGPLSPLLCGRLLVRGGGTQVYDALKRTGWDGKEPIAATVVTVDPADGTIRGLRHETRGSLEGIKFNAKDLFAEADAGITVNMRFPDLATLTWISTGDSSRNQTAWVESSSNNTTFRRAGDEILLEADLIEAGIWKFSTRFTLVMADVDKVVLYGGVVPYSKAEIEAKAAAAGYTSSSASCPTLALRLFSVKAKPCNGRPIAFGPTELREDGLGFGHLPLIEGIGAGEVVFPTRDDLEEQLTAFLRERAPTFNVSLQRLEGMWGKRETFAAPPPPWAPCTSGPATGGPLSPQP
jgi:hypothetical protein